MPSADSCSEDEIVQLVDKFYDQVRKDEALRGTARFHDAPLAKHAALHGLTIELFQRWRLLFGQITDALPNAALAAFSLKASTATGISPPRPTGACSGITDQIRNRMKTQALISQLCCKRRPTPGDLSLPDRNTGQAAPARAGDA